ncbi:hypothetical protein ACOJAS_10155 [Bifidobacterium breve]|uniref:hypothetical protein n=1 Tax=Bifidobacterium breve TaxID=1685 RepID=UPI003D012A69
MADGGRRPEDRGRIPALEKRQNSFRNGNIWILAQTTFRLVYQPAYRSGVINMVAHGYFPASF